MTGEHTKRLVARAMTRFLVTSAQVWARPHGGDLTQTFVFCTVLSANLEPFALDDAVGVLAAGGDDEDTAAKRPITVHAIASSLSLPYETVRRKALNMEAAGLITRTRTGIVVRSAALRTASMRDAMGQVRGLLNEVLAILRSTGLDMSGLAATAGHAATLLPPRDPLVARIVMSAQIRMLEQIAPIFGDVVRAYVFCGVLRANVDDLLTVPTLAWQYATEATLPPDEARRPVTMAELSRQLAMPRETVRRQISKMVDAGVIVVTHDGVFAPTHVLASDAATYQNTKLALEFFRMMSGLAKVGMLAAPHLPVPSPDAEHTSSPDPVRISI